MKQKKKKSKNELLPRENDTLISLLGVYLSEWEHREQFLWVQLFRFYFAILIVILFPNLTGYFHMTLPIHDEVFRIVGLHLSFIFLYVSIGYVMRFQASGDTYQHLIDQLPDSYQRKRVKDYKFGHFFDCRITYIVCISLFLTLFILAIIMLYV